jgi:C-terminal processing protease CtpA/Prc
MAYAIKKHHLARLVGDNTAGAVLPDSPYCLDNGAILYLTGSSLTADGEVLEARGVAPDIAVPFDIRYAAGRIASSRRRSTATARRSRAAHGADGVSAPRYTPPAYR